MSRKMKIAIAYVFVGGIYLGSNLQHVWKSAWIFACVLMVIAILLLWLEIRAEKRRSKVTITNEINISARLTEKQANDLSQMIKSYLSDQNVRGL